MQSSKIFKGYSKWASGMLVLYLSIMLSGCSFRPAELAPEEARQLQTRVLDATPEAVARAAIAVLQDMHYTLGNMDLEIGVITAERTSEHLLSPIARETVDQTELTDELGTFCLIAGTMAAVGVFLAWIFGDSSADEYVAENHHRHHHFWSRHAAPVVYENYNSGADSYRYSMTITLEDLNQQQTKVRVSVQGEHSDASGVLESGPIQSADFYADFYKRLTRVLHA